MDSQNNRLLGYMMEHGSITPLDAWTKLGIYRLSARVFDLRERGHGIATETVTIVRHDGSKMDVTKYTLRDFDNH